MDKVELRPNSRTYLMVFAALAVLTGIELGVAALMTGQTIRIIILLGLAASKAALVALYYMHLKYDNGILSIIGGFPLLLVMIMLLILLADV